MRTLLQEQVVSRKTPGDGRLQITPAVAERLAALGPTFRLASGGREDTGRLATLPCTCGKFGEGTHIHNFLESPVLRELAPGIVVRIELDETDSVVRVESA